VIRSQPFRPKLAIGTLEVEERMMNYPRKNAIMIISKIKERRHEFVCLLSEENFPER
jgi:hypothetical protein